MADGFNPLSLALGGVSDLAKTGFGIWQFLKGNKDYKNLMNNRPIYEQDQNILNNQKIAGQIASQGIPDATKNYFTEGVERGLGSSIKAGLDTGQGINGITSMYQNSIDAWKDFLSKDASQKLQNQNVLLGANKDVADENKTAFDYNQNIPFQLKLARANQQSNAGAQNIFGAANNATGLFGANAELGGNGGGGGNYTGNDWWKNPMLQGL